MYLPSSSRLLIFDDNLIQKFNDMHLDDIWYNKYQVGGNQEIHTHDKFPMSGIYFLENTGNANTSWWYGSNNMFLEVTVIIFLLVLR